MQLRRWFSMSLLACSLIACDDGDKDAWLSDPQRPVAVGAFVGFSFGDSCTGQSSGKLNISLCEYEALTAVTSVEITPPELFRVVPEHEWPAVFNPSGTLAQLAFVLQALGEGPALLRVRGTFTDGSERTASADLSARKLERLRLDNVCDPDAELPLRVPAGETAVVTGTMMHKSEELTGYLAGLLDAPGVTCDSTCAWSAPEGGSLRVSSRFDPTFMPVLEAYSGRDVTSVEVEEGSQEQATYAPNAGVSYQARVLLGGKRPCRGVRIEAETRTPERCLGPNGARRWASEVGNTFRVAVLASGRCEVVLGGVGANKLPTVFRQTFKVASPETVARVAYPEQPCGEPGRSACNGSFSSVLHCEPMTQTWRERSVCSAGDACTVRTSKKCGEPGGCAVCN